MAKHLFVSYAHEDEAFRTELSKHLYVLKTVGLVESWDDRQLQPGDEWRKVLDEQLETADVVVFLVSPDFLASQFCRDEEMPRVLGRWKEKRVLVVPVIIRPCMWRDTPLAQLQVLPRNATPVSKWANKDDAWVHVVEQIRDLAKAADRAARRASPPVPKPRTFPPADVVPGVDSKPSSPRPSPAPPPSVPEGRTLASLLFLGARRLRRVPLPVWLLMMMAGLVTVGQTKLVRQIFVALRGPVMSERGTVMASATSTATPTVTATSTAIANVPATATATASSSTTAPPASTQPSARATVRPPSGPRPLPTVNDGPPPNTGVLHLRPNGVCGLRIDGGQEQTPILGGLTQRVDAGEHTVSFTHPELGQQTISVTVMPGETTVLEVRCR